MRKILLIIFISNFLILQGQEKANQFLNEKINEDLESSEIFNSKIQKLNEYGLDSLDIRLISNRAFLAQLIINDIPGSTISEVRYKDLLKLFENYKSQKPDDYKQIRDYLEIQKILENKIADLKTWKEDEKLLVKIELPEKNRNFIYNYLKSNPESNLTYKEIIILSLEKEKENKENLINNTEDQLLIKSEGSINFSNLLEQSKNSDKPVLLFFTGYAAINALKMQDKILSDTDIKELIEEKFIFQSLFVDDKRKSKKSENLNIGQVNANFQKEYFKSNRQPFFAIINSKGEILKTMNYTNDKKDFEDFLLNGMKKF